MYDDTVVRLGRVGWFDFAVVVGATFQSWQVRLFSRGSVGISAVIASGGFGEGDISRRVYSRPGTVC